MSEKDWEVDGWRAFYVGGREFTSAEYEWEDLPDDGLLILVVYYDEYAGDGNVQYKQTHSECDWYFHRPGTDFFGCNKEDIEENKERYPDCIFKRGKWTTKEEYAEIKRSIPGTKAPQ